MPVEIPADIQPLLNKYVVALENELPSLVRGLYLHGSVAMGAYPYYHDGQLQSDRRDEVNAVTWWLIKNRGVALIGPDPQELEIEINGDRLKSYPLQESIWPGRRSTTLLAFYHWRLQQQILSVTSLPQNRVERQPGDCCCGYLNLAPTVTKMSYFRQKTVITAWYP